MYSVKPVLLESACPKTCIHAVSSHFDHFFLVKIEFIFFHHISYLKNHICSLKYTHKVVFDQEELLKITWKSLFVGFWACQLQWWWLKVCLTNSLWDKVCILLNNGNFVKIILSLGFSLIPPLTPSFCLPRWNMILIPQKCPWPTHKKRVQAWNEATVQ